MSKRPRVLQLIELNISNRWIHGLSRLMEPNWDLTIASLPPSGPLQDDAAREGLRVAALGASRRLHYPAAAVRLWLLLRRNRTALIHTHGFETSLLSMVVVAATPRIVWIYTHHHQPHFFELAVMRRWKRRIVLWLDKMLAMRASAIVAASQPVSDAFQGIGVPISKIHLIPLGFDLTRIEVAGASGVDAVRGEFGLTGVLSALSVGRLAWEKDHDTTMKAWQQIVAHYPGARLLIAGAGPLHQKLVALADRLGIAENVTFTGFRRDLPAMMCAVNLLIHSAATESFGQVTVEAMVLGRPVVSTPVGVTAALQDGRHYLCVPHGDQGALVAAIRRIADNSAFAGELGLRGRAFAHAHFSIEENARAYGNLYRALLQG